MSAQVTTPEVELLTDTHRILGYLPGGEGRLTDILNLDPEDPVLLDNVRTTPVCDPEIAPLVTGFAQINKDAIAFGLPHEPPVTQEKRQDTRAFEYVEKTPHLVLISLPPFTITGYLHLAREADLRTALQSLTRNFIPISEAQAVYVLNPSIKWTSEVIIVNRKRAQIFWPLKKS